MGEPRSSDEDLLARLNALKRSHIDLDTETPVKFASTSTSQTTDTDLASRFQKLNNKAAVAAENPSSRSDLDSRTEPNPEDDKTFEELLEELGPEEQWNVNEYDERTVEALLKEAKSILPEPDNTNVGPGESAANASRSDDEEDPEEGKTQEQVDDALAEDYVQKLLSQLEIEKKYGDLDSSEEQEPHTAEAEQETAPPTEPHPHDKDSPLELPNTPTTFHEKKESDNINTMFDSLGLPSAPTFSPVKKGVKGRKNQHFTDEEIDSWCCLCMEDGTVQCLGCDRDVYCARCWKDMHMGPDSGLEEKLHKWIKFTK